MVYYQELCGDRKGDIIFGSVSAFVFIAASQAECINNFPKIISPFNPTFNTVPYPVKLPSVTDVLSLLAACKMM